VGKDRARRCLMVCLPGGLAITISGKRTFSPALFQPRELGSASYGFQI
jgi:hypothetical protein